MRRWRALYASAEVEDDVDDARRAVNEVVEVVARRARVSNAREEDIVIVDSSRAILYNGNCTLAFRGGSIDLDKAGWQWSIDRFKVYESKLSIHRTEVIPTVKRCRLFKSDGSVQQSAKN
jgi:hypothetical protein